MRQPGFMVSGVASCGKRALAGEAGGLRSSPSFTSSKM